MILLAIYFAGLALFAFLSGYNGECGSAVELVTAVLWPVVLFIYMGDVAKRRLRR